MLLRYLVVQTSEGWVVSEGGQVLSACAERSQALQLARLGAYAAKATGADAVVFAQGEGDVLEAIALDSPF